MTGDVLRVIASLALIAADVILLVTGVRAVKHAVAYARERVASANAALRQQRADIPDNRAAGRRFIENLLAARIVEHGADAPVDPALNIDLYVAAWDVYETHRLPNPWVAQGIQVGLLALTDTLVEMATSNPYPDPAPTLGDLLDKVRATSLADPPSVRQPHRLDHRQPATAGATR